MLYCGNDKLQRHCCSTLQMNCSEVPIQRQIGVCETSRLTSYSSGQLSHQLNLSDCEPALWITELRDMSLSSFQNQFIAAGPSSLPLPLPLPLPHELSIPLFPESRHLFRSLVLTICLLYPYFSPKLCPSTWSFSLWNYMSSLKCPLVSWYVQYFWCWLLIAEMNQWMI